MKKILSVLVALLLIISIPASAATKKTEKDHHYKKPVKQIKVSITSNHAVAKIGEKVVLTAKTNKQGLNVLEGNVLGQGWTAAYSPSSSEKPNVFSSFSVTKNASKNNPVSTLEFIPTSAGTYTFSYAITMGAGKSKTKFYGKATYSVKVSGVAEQSLSTYKFVVDKPSYIQPATNVNIPVTLMADKIRELGYKKVLIMVECTKKPDGSIVKLTAKDTLNREYDVANIGYWGPLGGFEVTNNYNVTTNFTANFSLAGDYSIKLSLVDLLNNNSVITSTTIDAKVGVQPGVIRDFGIHDFTVLPLENSDKMFKLYVTRLTVVYENLTSDITLNEKYYVGTIKLSDLDNAGFEKSFYVTYGGITKYFTFTGKQIQDLL